MKIDKKINLKKKNQWSFKDIADNFEDHITKSVPHYKNWHNLICSLSNNFLDQKNTIFTELGTSTGLLSRSLSNYHILNKTLKIYSYDIEPKMIKKAKSLSKKNKNINFLCKDIIKHKFKKSNCIFSYYTLQFIPQKSRQLIVNKVYDNLEWGGGFFLFEKIRGNDARFQDYFIQTYNDFKTNNGLTDIEILNKTRSLRSVLDPFSSKGNLDLLKRSGFKDISTIAQWANFKGWLAIK